MKYDLITEVVYESQTKISSIHVSHEVSPSWGSRKATKVSRVRACIPLFVLDPCPEDTALPGDPLRSQVVMLSIFNDIDTTLGEYMYVQHNLKNVATVN